MIDARSSLRRGLRRLTDPRAIGWPLFWISFAVFALDGFPTFLGAPLDGSTLTEPLAVLASATVSQFILFALLLVARATYLRTPLAHRHPAWTVWSMFWAAVVADAATNALFSAVHVSGDVAVVPSVLDHAITEAAGLCVIGILVVVVAEHRDATAALLDAQAELRATRDSAERALQLEGAAVRDRVDSRVRSVASMLDGADAAAAIRELRSLAEVLVRPLSHELAVATPDFTRTGKGLLPYPPWRRVWAGVVGQPLISPVPMALTTLFLAGRLTVTAQPVPVASDAASVSAGDVTLTVSMDQLATAILELGTIFGVTWFAAMVGRRLSVLLLRKIPTAGHWLVAMLSIAFIAALAQLLVAVAYLLPGYPAPPEVSAWSRLLLVVPLLLVSLAVGISRVVSVRQSSLREELQRTNDDLAWEIAKTNESLWQQRRQTSRLLHGPIQAAINAGAIRLDAAVRGRAVPSELVEDVRALIILSLDELKSTEAAPRDVASELLRIRSMWAAICEVEFEHSPATIERLKADPTCAAAALDIVSEACANAAIHGHATRVLVRIQPHGARLLRIEVADNGRGATGSEAVGLGARILDEVTTKWSIDFRTVGSTLEALIPVS